MSSVTERIKERIAQAGQISFADFMEMALYYPELGYYTSPRATVGAEGDYYTSSVTHPVFAALIAIQLEQMWHLLGSPKSFALVEMGAGKGLLGREILAYLPHLSPQLAQATNYIGLEREQAWIIHGCRPWTGTSTLKRAGWEVLDPEGVTGCFLSNELLDALPTHRVIQQGGRLKEIYVTLVNNEFAEAVGEPSTPMLERQLADEGITLPEGYTTEVNLNLGLWMKEVAQRLKRGFVITFDYGYPAREFYTPGRRLGTLMTYYRHTFGTNPYLGVGRQDITSHVDFTAVIRSGERNGLQFWGLTSQREFLLNLGLNVFIEALASKGLDHSEYMANRFSMLELVRTQGLGRFRVLIQGKGYERATLYGFTPNNEMARAQKTRLPDLEVPLLSREYVPLWSTRYPHAFLPEDLSAVLSGRRDSK